jgi:hypothetical protein
MAQAKLYYDEKVKRNDEKIADRLKALSVDKMGWKDY